MNVTSSSADCQFQPPRPLSETPILRLFREHEALCSRANDLATPYEESDRLCDLAIQVADQIAEEPATNLVDLARKVMTPTAVSDHDLYPWSASAVADCKAIIAAENRRGLPQEHQTAVLDPKSEVGS